MSQQSASSHIISCPNCNTKLSLVNINSHLDSCLGGSTRPASLKTVLNGRISKKPSLTRNSAGSSVTASSITSFLNRNNSLNSGEKSLGREDNNFNRGENNFKREDSTISRGENNFNRVSNSLNRNNSLIKDFNASERTEQTPAKCEKTFGSKKEVLLLDDDDEDNNDVNGNNKLQNQPSQVYETKFEDPVYLKKIETLPLFERLKPQCLKTYIGQNHLLNKDTGIIYKHLTQSVPNIPNMILFGPPSIGKTSLVAVLLNELNKTEKSRWKMFHLSGVTLSTTELKQLIDKSITDFKNWKMNTIIFIDEIHRLNKLQQDSLLKIAEMGHCRLIGCTTENPSFKINNAVLSRLDVFVLKSYTGDEKWKMFEQLVKVQCFYKPKHRFESDETKKKIFEKVLALSDDNRRFISIFENLYLFAEEVITESVLDKLLNSDAFKDILYYNTDTHYELISAFHKSVRGSNSNAALYYMFKMLKSGCDPLYICRRMIRIASEDVGVVNHHALIFANSTYESCMKLGMPESDVILAHCCVLLCESPKSVKIYRSMNRIKAALDTNPTYRDGAVPLHLRNAPTKLMEQMGYKVGYKYNPDFEDGVVDDQEYFPSTFYRNEMSAEAAEIESLKHVYDNEKHLG